MVLELYSSVINALDSEKNKHVVVIINYCPYDKIRWVIVLMFNDPHRLFCKTNIGLKNLHRETTFRLFEIR